MLRGNAGQGIVEQIDGVIALDGDLYLVEMKWWAEPLDLGEISHHLVRVFARGGVRGFFIANPGYTDAAVVSCKEFLQQKVFLLADLEEQFRVAAVDVDLAAYLKKKVEAAVIDKNPYSKPDLPPA